MAPPNTTPDDPNSEPYLFTRLQKAHEKDWYCQIIGCGAEMTEDPAILTCAHILCCQCMLELCGTPKDVRECVHCGIKPDGAFVYDRNFQYPDGVMYWFEFDDRVRGAEPYVYPRVKAKTFMDYR